jgi:hypothetical protein
MAMKDLGEPLAEALPVGVELVAIDEHSYSFKLSLGKGAALLHATRQTNSPVANASLSSESSREGAQFVREVARWLGVKASPASRSKPPIQVPIAVLSLGRLERQDGVDWKALKLVLGEEEHVAELYLNVAIEEDRGELAEKDSARREVLVGLLRSALGSAAEPPVTRARSAKKRKR